MYLIMARKLFSHSFRRDHRPVTNQRLLNSLRDLTQYLGGGKLKPLLWDENHLAIALNVVVELPPLGNIGGLDIRPLEPVILVLSRTNYPIEPPRVYPDRLDFPKDQLAHLYIARNGRPPGFCLVRGDFTEWYANKRLPDVVARTRNWLRDAATGELTLNGQQFDPLRLEGYRGSISYPYNVLSAIVHADEHLPAGNFAAAFFENTASNEATPSFRLDRVLTAENIEVTIQEYVRGIEALSTETFGARKYHFGYLVWTPNAATYSTYRADLPRDWEGLVAFCQEFGIDLIPLEHFLVTADLNSFPEVPVICALKRPSNLIGFNSNLEFINFYLTLTEVDKDKEAKTLRRELPVNFQVHNEPLTRQKAQLVAGAAPLVGSTWVAGCGALGSKVVMHLARSGTTNLSLFDPDYLAPHNLVRHALLADYVGMNKALALKKAIAQFYSSEQLPSLRAIALSADILLLPHDDTTFAIERLLDFTASEAFLHTLIASPLLNSTVVGRGLISDHGQLGILAIEGSDRNPRLDDLQVMLYAQYAHRPAVGAWLAREAAHFQGDTELISVGVGCNSETTVLTDETVTTHAAYFAEVLRHGAVEMNQPRKGKLFLSRLSLDDGYPTITTEHITVEPLQVLLATNDSTWQIRMVPAVLQTMRAEFVRATPYETGGVLLGRADYKTKTIHVVELLLAPPDSQANSVCFSRGTRGLPEKVAAMTSATGSQLGYIGEWHTHPEGPNGMSHTDHETAQRFKREFATLTSPLPVFLFIITPNDNLAFVY